MIFRGYRVHVVERDISVDSSYKKLSLPLVFIRGEHVGGAEKIKQLNERGELAKLLVGFPVDDSFGASCGSCEVFDQECERFRRCMDCNENSLIQCPGRCCS